MTEESKQEEELFIQIHEELSNELFENYVHPVDCRIQATNKFIQARDNLSDAITDYTGYKVKKWMYSKPQRKRKSAEIKYQLLYCIQHLMHVVAHYQKNLPPLEPLPPHLQQELEKVCDDVINKIKYVQSEDI